MHMKDKIKIIYDTEASVNEVNRKSSENIKLKIKAMTKMLIVPYKMANPIFLDSIQSLLSKMTIAYVVQAYETLSLNRTDCSI